MSLPETVRLLPRLRTGWASYGLAEAELSGYRAALAQTDADHIALCTGSDYPLASAAKIAATLDVYPGLSWLEIDTLPNKNCGPLRGYDRFLWRNRVRERRREWSPIPRPRPKGSRPAGGSQLKILARRHEEHLLGVLDERPDLVSYRRRSTPALFARKFDESATEVLDAIDAELRVS